MRYVFFGTPEFAAIILERLIKAGFIPEAVVCNPDKPVGRKQIITPPPVKQRIMNYESGIKNKIKILQPEKLDPSLFIIPNSSFDFFIVAAYAKILPKEILEIPRLGVIGVHPSLLPKYRGPTPIQTAILNGDEKTGTTLFLIDEKVDRGPILSQETLNYELRIMNYEELSQKLAELGADLLIKFFGRPTSLNFKDIGHPQDESQTTYTKKFSTEDAYIKPQDLEKAQSNGGQIALEIERKIRALNPEPGTWTLRQTQGKLQRMKILEAEIIGNRLKLKKIQFEGKKTIEI